MRIIDLTREINNETQVCPCDRTPVVEDYATTEEEGGADFAILNTGWEDYYGTWDFFRHPYLSEGAAKALVELGIKIVGTDGSSADAAYGFSTAKRLANPTFMEILENMERENVRNEAHGALLGNECLIVEYLCNLKALPKEPAIYSFLPLKITEADGSPVRAVCIQEMESKR